MKHILKEHRQDFSEIRKLCLICHGLDYTTSSLSSTNSRLKLSEAIEGAIQNLVSSYLLNLAIAIRVNLYQNKIEFKDVELPESGTLYYDKELICRPVTLKQVCDKIIHADTVSKPILPSVMMQEDCKICIQFKGTEFKKAWTMDIVLELFAEDVLHILDSIETQCA